MSQEKTESTKKKFNRELAKRPPEGFPSRLLDFVNYIKVEKQKLAEIGGVTPPSINAYCNGTSQPAAGVLARWVQFFRVNANWLLTGEGAMLLDDSPPPTEQLPPQPEETPLQREIRTIEEVLTRRGMTDREVGEAVMARLGVETGGSIPGVYPVAESARHRRPASVQEEAAAFGAKPDDPDDPVT